VELENFDAISRSGKLVCRPPIIDGVDVISGTRAGAGMDRSLVVGRFDPTPGAVEYLRPRPDGRDFANDAHSVGGEVNRNGEVVSQ
jgi:hypothetical protein